MGKLETVQDGCAYLAALFETYWDTMHPSLEEYGFQGRKGPCESLTRIGEFLGPLRRTPVVVHPRLGSFTGEDLERFAQQGDSADGYGMFRAAIQAVPEEELKETLERIDAIRDSIRRVDEILTRHADGDTATNFLSTYQALDGVRRGLAPFVGEQVIEIVEEVSPEPPLGLQPVAGATPTVAGRPESRDDVIRSLDAIIDYYRRREPASPVPVALARAKRWVSMDFLAVLQDIAPESLGDARKVLVSGNDTSNDDDNY
jgi:type VI secretion system protein ImpA